MSTEEPNVVWALEGYSKGDGSLVSESPISREQVILLRAVIDPDPDDPWMIFCYLVPADRWLAVDRILSCGESDPNLDYLTSAYAAS
ncbi:hypothetical protein ABZZ36_41370 [Actinacidiphila glaucinigra]|uniref:DUF7683 domain-containing protein n=1 Tax=Actinacidiphila glaucinigra TaxID=235986 RepID=UPI0033AF6918